MLCIGALAQIDSKANEWLERSVNTYGTLKSLQSKTTVTLQLITPRNPQGETIQKFLYAYTLQPPAQINLLIRDALSREEGTRFISDGKTLKSGERTVAVQGSGLALLEGLASLDAFTPYDIVFALGGKSSWEKMKQEITNLRVVSDDEKQVVLGGRVRGEKERINEWEFVIDKSTLLMRRIKIVTQVKLEEQPAQFVMVMEFEPTPNVPVTEQTFSLTTEPAPATPPSGGGR